jgi:hypothetical protein
MQTTLEDAVNEHPPPWNGIIFQCNGRQNSRWHSLNSAIAMQSHRSITDLINNTSPHEQPANHQCGIKGT